MSGALDHSPAEIVRKLLVDLSQGTEPSAAGSWPIFAAREPTNPDSLITVFSTGIEHQGRDMNDGEVKDRYTVSVRVRCASDNTGYIKASNIGQALDKSVRNMSVTISSKTYLVYAASRKNGPLALGNEPESKRVVFSLNYSLAIKQTA